jgi:hypothetical protein
VSPIEQVGSQDRSVSRSVSSGSKIGQFGLDEAKSLYLLSSWFGVRVPAGAQDLAIPANCSGRTSLRIQTEEKDVNTFAYEASRNR